MTTPSAAPARRRRATLAITFGVVVVLLIAFFVFAGLYTDALWYGQLGYLGVLTTEWATISTLFAVGFLGMAAPVFASIQLAYRLRPVYAKLTAQLDRYQQVIEPLRRVVMIAVPVVIGLFAAVSAATRWQPVLLFLHPQTVGRTDAQFHLDLGFYLFTLPVLHGIVGYASAALVVSLVAAIATAYLYGAIRVAGREVRVARAARVQIAVTIAVYLLVQAVSLVLDRFMTVYQGSSGGHIVGAGFTDVHSVIPGRLILAVLCVLTAALFTVTAFAGRWRIPLVGTVALVAAAVLVGSVYPWVQQNFFVAPSYLGYESQYFQRNIDATRTAYGVDGVQAINYQATTNATQNQLRQDADTTANIRIIDPDVVSPTFSQFQQFRQYYGFQNALDVDRYPIDGTTQDAVVGVRELNEAQLATTQTAYSNAFVYTHGYGFVGAYGTKRSSDGTPSFFSSEIPQSGALSIAQPRVYFGKDSPAYSVVGAESGTAPIELDYPTGSSSQSYTTYTGDGGPSVGSLFNRLVYALKFQSDQILLSNTVNAKSQILYDRDPADRVQKAAPYLTIDSDPYPSVVDGRITWIVDGYTTASTYPYSTDQSLSAAISTDPNAASPYATDQVNYIRNSVKATVDAYTGKVTLYAWDASDPVLKAWQQVFPATVKPMSDMSAQLISHVRYPADLFRVQRTMLQSYHVTNPITWATHSDQWRTPTDPTSSSSTTTALQPPYYLTMKAPNQSSPAFSIYSTFIPDQTGAGTVSTLRGYLVADADAGTTAGTRSSDYGTLRLLELPTGASIPAPGQAESLIQSDPTVRTTLYSLNSAGAKVINGNLLTLPVGGGFLYVEPIYVQSDSGAQYPLLRKVAVSFGSVVKIDDTLDGALNSLFGGNAGASAGDSGVSSGTSGSSNGSSGGSTGGTSSGTSAALKKALANAEAAITARQKAYANNDQVAAAEAEQQLETAVQQAIAAGG